MATETSENPEYKDCKHCQTTGTCKNGKDNQSCHSCSSKLGRMFGKPSYGAVCSVCKGNGFVEPVATRLIHRVGPVIGIIVVSPIVIVAAYGVQNHFSETLAFVSTLAGTVVAYHFNNKKK